MPNMLNLETKRQLTCFYSGWSEFLLLNHMERAICWKREKWEETKNDDMHYKRRDSFTIRSKGWESSLTVPRDCIILLKSNVVYRNHVIGPATLSTLLSGWYSMAAWRSCQTTTGGCSSHGVSAGALAQRLPWCGLWTKAGLLFCSKLFLQPFLLLQDKPDQRGILNIFQQRNVRNICNVRDWHP
jgi:hypothetical protein